MNIDNIIDNIYPLPEKSKALLKGNIYETTFPKAHVLFKVNRISSKIYFIRKGMVRAFANPGDEDITFWFGKEGDAVISMKNYVQNEKGYETIELLEPCDLYELNTEHLRKLFNEDIHIANWGRKFAEQELIKIEERLIFRQCRTALERYKELMLTDPEILQRVQLGHIASYLGMTQVSLSRIRSGLK
ncbi:cAMP-binding domain of CRP or a regulatory subunit of cAMP-dependent protein kinases [Chitinophaga ginsengisegetis]|uniref:cAMP-binding domain of CRP or a regulatory subunit of cAMP-dependent protein kinases n=1 Tax=Chitinophaga ginsengisegetis TaxID=393003 RepID=A0A1T5P9R8_9BACT|nr:Crp/Fnr family transcriptional regulator [Chitinophaga ginsengisegetis]SKD09474.1 cAMP-binding domain of CRP or a regulatory subunit of cAMP-dependent protein kinases [Chitinophaga ginsengisegetis]